LRGFFYQALNHYLYIMFELPINKPSVKDTEDVASLICEAFYNEREMYKRHSNAVSKKLDGKVVFGRPDIGSGKTPIKEWHGITKDAFDLALRTIKDKGWHIYRREWYVPSGLNWSYIMCETIPMRVYNDNKSTILF